MDGILHFLRLIFDQKILQPPGRPGGSYVTDLSQ
jgi:hypothetical protein